MEALGDAIIVIAPDWRITYVNAPWERILGVRRSHAVDNDFWATYREFRKEPTGKLIRATAADGSTRRFDVEHHVPGELRSYGMRVARDANGHVVLALSPSFRTMKSSRERALEERNEENAALRALAKQTAEVADTSALLTILCEAAKAQCAGHGVALASAGDTEGDLLSAVGLLAPAQGTRFNLEGSIARELLESHEVAMVEDFSSTRRPLARRLSNIPIGPLFVAPLIAHERVLGVLVVVRDRRSVPFTTREAQRLGVVADHAALALWKSQLLEQAREADRAKGRFLATMSHELRTPLTALAGYEELLVDEVLGSLSDSQREVLERMHYVTDHLAAMIEDVLAYTNLETGGEAVRATDFLAADLVTAVAAVVQQLAEATTLNVTSESAAHPIRMSSDVDKARQILVNLASNAIKFTERGEVRLSVMPSDGEVRFAVRDTGIGIAKGDVQHLFRPFTQLDSGLTRRHGGTGLGLYISHRLAKLLRGRIEVQSELGEGSTFTLILPRE